MTFTRTEDSEPRCLLPAIEEDQPKQEGAGHPTPLAQALHSIQRIHESLDLDVVLSTTVVEVRQLFQVERVFLVRLGSDWNGVVVEECALGCLPLQGQQACDHCFAEKWVSAYAQDQMQVVGDIEAADLTPCHRDWLKSLGAQANLTVPLWAHGRLWGLLVSQHCSAPHSWQLAEVQMMQQLAVQVGLAIQQAERYQQMQTELSAYQKAEAHLLNQVQRSHNRHFESIDTLSRGIAHDLSDILTPIMLAAEMLKQPALNSEQQQWLNRIHTGAHQGFSLVDQILSCTQGRGEPRGDIQLAYLLGELVQTLQETHPEGIAVTSQLQLPRLWTVSANASHLYRAFMNLCLNSFESMVQGGTLHIEARNVWWRGALTSPQPSSGPCVVVTVSDTGSGMPAAIRDRSCDPFFTTRAEAGHSGLGLSTAQGLVKAHGGWLNIDSQPGSGTTIAVYLPAKVEVSALISELVSVPAGLEGGNALVLLVMADNSTRELHRTLLEGYGYRVLVAEEGVDAIALFIQHQAELGTVVLDLALPTLNGTAMLHRMQYILPTLPLVALGNGNSVGVGVIMLPPVPSGLTLLNTLAQVCPHP